METLTSIDSKQCHDEMISLGTYLDSYSDRTPRELIRQQEQVLDALSHELARAS